MAKVANVNTADILDAIRLGCRTMSSVFDADDGNVPFFRSTVRPEARLAFSPDCSESHVPGRHLNAMLTAESVAGVDLDEGAVENHARATFMSYGGPVALPLNRDRVGGRLVNFRSHNVREGFHALYALVKYRQSEAGTAHCRGEHRRRIRPLGPGKRLGRGAARRRLRPELLQRPDLHNRPRPRNRPTGQVLPRHRLPASPGARDGAQGQGRRRVLHRWRRVRPGSY